MPVSTRVILNGAKELDRSLEAVRRTIKTGSAARLAATIGREGLRIVQILTPRQRNPANRKGSTSRGFPPLYREWEMVERSISGSIRQAVIRNKAAKQAQGLTVLASLEFGARPHAIFPKNAKRLSWEESSKQEFSLFRGRTGAIRPGDIHELFETRLGRDAVFAKRVSHPGHRPFQMVQHTRERLQMTIVMSLTTLGDDIQRAFAGAIPSMEVM